ncbi:MAG: carbohydrate ABC transporter permease [Candidatus Dormibacteraceae bacterium]
MPYACLSPAALLIAVFVVWPVASVFYYSLQVYNVTEPWLDQFVGLQNFVKILTSDAIFRESLLVSLKWVVVQVVLQFVIGLGVALVLNRSFRGRGLARSLIFSPWAVAGVVVTATWTLMYQPLTGMLDTVLIRIGIIHSPIQWLSDPHIVFGSVSLAELWRGVPFFAIILLAGLQGIPGDLYEAASVDGARRWQSFWRLTLPLLKDTIILATLLRGVWEFNNVDVIYTMTDGGPGTETTTLPIYIVNQAIQYHNFCYGAALSVISFVILLGFALGYLKLGRFGQQVY